MLINLMLVEVLVCDHEFLVRLLVIVIQLVLYLPGVGGLETGAPLGLLARRRVDGQLRR